MIHTMPWADHAACAGMTVDTFYPDDDATEGEQERVTTAAKRICRICPTRAECLELALALHEAEGIWGGMTYDERRLLRRRLGRKGARPRVLAPCGTEAAYRRHQRNGTPIDDACREANRAAQQAKTDARKAAA